MNTKLTLRMDQALIASAKDYAAAHGSSVSRLVANYFAALGHLKPNQSADPGPPPGNSENRTLRPGQQCGPITRSLTGILKAQPGQPQVSEDDYKAYLEHKYMGDPSQSGQQP